MAEITPEEAIDELCKRGLYEIADVIGDLQDKIHSLNADFARSHEHCDKYHIDVRDR